MTYYYSQSGVYRDELSGGQEIAQEIWNVRVGENAVIERGALLCSDAVTGEWSQVNAESDAQKILGIATENFTADSEHKITSIYVSGKFNREKIKIGELSIEKFEPELRKQNIHLTSII